MRRLPKKGYNQKSDSIPFTCQIRPGQIEALNEEAARTGLNRSDLVRQIIDMYFELPE